MIHRCVMVKSVYWFSIGSIFHGQNHGTIKRIALYFGSGAFPFSSNQQPPQQWRRRRWKMRREGAGEVETNGAHYEVGPVGRIAINVPRSWKLAVIAAQTDHLTMTEVHRLKRVSQDVLLTALLERSQGIPRSDWSGFGSASASCDQWGREERNSSSEESTAGRRAEVSTQPSIPH